MNSKLNEFDKQFINNIKNIMDHGTSYTSRAIYEDGTQSTCKKLFSVVNRYNSDYSNTPPVSVLRRLAMKSAFDELLWIWQKKSNNIHDLNSHVWDSWADANGSIGAAYGFQVRSKLRKASHEVDHEDGSKTVETLFLDQTDYVLHELIHNPFSRRIVTTLYAIDETSLMGLDPCCYSCTWNVTEKDGTKYLNLLLNQRSQDMIVANNWNVFQYWLLQNLFAIFADMEVGELVHVIADCHIYDRHYDIAKYLIELAENEENEFSYPKVGLVTGAGFGNTFYDVSVNDLIVENYKPLSHIKGIEVAI